MELVLDEVALVVMTLLVLLVELVLDEVALVLEWVLEVVLAILLVLAWLCWHNHATVPGGHESGPTP